MPTARQCASALCVKQAPDAVLVVGGAVAGKCAELLCGYESQAGQSWRWRTLSPMRESRFKPGVLLLSDDEKTQRILVAGGGRNTTELLKISCAKQADQGQWTSIAPLSSIFNATSLVFFNNRILAFGR